MPTEVSKRRYNMLQFAEIVCAAQQWTMTQGKFQEREKHFLKK